MPDCIAAAFISKRGGSYLFLKHTELTEIAWSASVRIPERNAEMLVGKTCGTPSARSAGEKPDLHQIRLVHIL